MQILNAPRPALEYALDLDINSNLNQLIVAKTSLKLSRQDQRALSLS